MIFSKERQSTLMNFVSSYLNQVSEAILALPAAQIDEIIETLITARLQGRTIFLCGNGGSAATASHMACDLAKNTIKAGIPSFRVIALTDNVPLMTAWGNDTNFDNIFAAQLEPFVQAGDVLIAISTSGNSPNILKAVEVAEQVQAITIGLTDQVGGKLKDRVSLCLKVPCTTIEQVEDIHMVLAHCIASGVRAELQQRTVASLSAKVFAENELVAVAR
jgi:D-sedoheptulose 7-phosphate isomerase